MRVVKPSRVRAYCRAYPDAASALLAWLKQARAARWRSIRDVRATYPHADAVRVESGREVTVFNIRGGNYRLIVAIKYRWGMLYVLRFLTHREYDRDRWKEEL
ncbi:MAG: type II toxin-antitoxin system HigB family toxin [Tepidisphaeraceae bacterium]